jgi:hypothetical protein
MLCIPAFPSQGPHELGTLPQSRRDSAGRRNKISSQFLLTAEEYKAQQYQHTFKSLPEYVILASDSRSTSDANSFLDNITLKIFSLFDASGRPTINMSIRISAKSYGAEPNLFTCGPVCVLEWVGGS